MRFLPLLLILPVFSPEVRDRARARAALWLVRLAARLDIQVVVMASSAIVTLAEMAAQPPEKVEEFTPRLN